MARYVLARALHVFKWDNYSTEVNVMNKIQDIAEANALAAIDQELEYESMDASIAAYMRNVIDTLAEEGLQNDIAEARIAYYTCVVQFLEEHRNRK
jgi:plasmid replication initiation protein